MDQGKKKKSTWKIIINILSILCVLTFLFVAYSIYLWDGIETELRYIAMGVLLLINAVIILLRVITRKKKIVSYIIYILILGILTGAQAFGGYYIFKFYSDLASFNKNEITYTSNIVVLKDTEIDDISTQKNKKIGIVTDSTSIDGYVMATEIIKEYKLDETNIIVEYETIESLIEDLYAKDLDAIITTSNYINMFPDNETYKNIKTDTKVIYEKSKVYTKEEINSYEGDEINFNKSGSINKPFTILIMGIDSTANTLETNATGNGDSLMLVTFNPKTLNMTILSIPRDSYVYVPCLMGGIENKITHAAWGGSSCMIRAIQGFTGINIDYYVKVNFKGVVKLVEALGGIDVEVPTDLCTDNSSRGSKVCIKEGYQTLNGEEALAFARNRYAFATGDFQRGLNQQVVVQGIINKLKTIKSTSQAMDVWNAVKNNIDTNLSIKQILSLYDVAKVLFETSTTENIINLQQLYLSGSGQMIYDERAQMVLYNYVLNKCGLNQVISVMKQNLNISSPTMIKKIDLDNEETFSMSIIGKNPSCGTSVYSLVPYVEGKTESQAKTILSGYGLTVEVEEKEITDGSYKDGIVISQQYPAQKRIDKIADKKIKIVVARVEEEEPPVVIPPSGGDEGGGEEEPETPPQEPETPTVTPSCSNPEYTTETDCTTNGGTWS